MPVSNSKTKNISFFLLIAIAIASFITCMAIFFIGRQVIQICRTRQSTPVTAPVTPPTDSEKKEVSQYQIELSNDDPSVGGVVKSVAKHMFIPRGDVTVGTVQNAEGLRKENPDFYAYAKDGDKVLYYPNGIILYDPVIDRIIDVWRTPKVVN